MLVIRKVTQAEVTLKQSRAGAIGKGLLILVGFEHQESKADFVWMAKKISQLSIY